MEGLIPLYELASDPQRQKDIKAVMDGDGFVTIEYEDKNNYQIEIPTFSDELNATLVKDIKDSNNRVVATVCNEFIPEISMQVSSRDMRVVVLQEYHGMDPILKLWIMIILKKKNIKIFILEEQQQELN